MSELYALPGAMLGDEIEATRRVSTGGFGWHIGKVGPLPNAPMHHRFGLVVARPVE
jgi:hypothetical protein